MNRRLLTLCAIVPALTATEVRTNFEGGSLGRIEKLSETHFRLGVSGEKDQDGRNRQASWYYFAVDNAPRQELILDMVDLPGEYNYQKNPGAITGVTPPWISFGDDRKTWLPVAAEYDPAEPRLRLRILPSGRSFRVAHVPPYTNADLESLRSRALDHPDFAEEIIGRTPEGRDLRLWTIHHGSTEGRKTIWLMFRQHSWEAGSSWVGEGVVAGLLADESLRRDIVWKILPLCDPDGVARGGVRFNKYGYDLNRNWDVSDPEKMPEIAAQRSAIERWLKAGHSIDLFLTLHNTETAEYLLGPSGDSGKFRTLAEEFFQILKDKTSFAPSRPLGYSPTVKTFADRGRKTVVQGLLSDFGIPAFLMEQRIAHNEKLGRQPNIPDRILFGGELIRAAAAAVLRK